MRQVGLGCTTGSWNHHHHHHLSLNREGRLGTTDDLTTSFLHFPLFPMPSGTWPTPGLSIPWCCLNSHFFLCLPCPLPLFTVPCKMVLARPDERETRPYHCSLRLFTMVRRSFVWSDCLLDLGSDFLVGNMVFMRCVMNMKPETCCPRSVQDLQPTQVEATRQSAVHGGTRTCLR